MKWDEVLTLWICRTSPLLFCSRAQGRGIWRGAELDEVANRILGTQHFAHSPAVVGESAPSCCVCRSRGQSPDIQVAIVAHKGVSRLCCIAGHKSDYGGRPSQSVLGILLSCAGLASLNVGANVDLSQKLGASAIVGYLPHSHARQCDFGGGIGAAHGANGKMLGPFGACAQVGLAGRYLGHRGREARGETPCV